MPEIVETAPVMPEEETVEALLQRARVFQMCVSLRVYAEAICTVTPQAEALCEQVLTKAAAGDATWVDDLEFTKAVVENAVQQCEAMISATAHYAADLAKSPTAR